MAPTREDFNSTIYVNQTGSTFTTLGGPFWIDAGEIRSQATVTSVVTSPTASFDEYYVMVTINDGYDIDVGAINAPRQPP